MSRKEGKDEEAESEPLSEVQRLSLVEKGITLNRVIIGLIALLLIVTLSVSITTLILDLASSDEASDMRLQLDTLSKQSQEAISQQSVLIRQVEELQAEQARLKAIVAASEATALRQQMIAREMSTQQFLSGMKEGMTDLARMVSGSRSWLEIYRERIDTVIRESREREQALRELMPEN